MSNYGENFTSKNSNMTFGDSEIISNLNSSKYKITNNLQIINNKNNRKKDETDISRCETLVGFQDTRAFFLKLPKNSRNTGKYSNNNAKSLEHSKQNIALDSNSKDNSFKGVSNGRKTIIKKENSISIKKFINKKGGIVGLTPDKEKPFSINAIVQCLSNINRFRDYLIKEENYNNLIVQKKDKKVSFALANIFKYIC